MLYSMLELKQHDQRTAEVGMGARPARRTAMLVAFLLPFALTVPVEAAKRAFVVGINRYEHFSEQRQLTRAVADATAIAAELRAVGFSVTLVTDVTEKPTLLNWSLLQDKFSIFSRTVEAGDTTLLYFSGHGTQRDGRNYLIPADAPEPNKTRSVHAQISKFIPFQAWMDELRDRSPLHRIAILDACRDDPYDVLKTKSSEAKGGLAVPRDSGNTFIMYAAKEDQTALDRLPGNADDSNPTSPYTRTLLKWLARYDVPIARLAQGVRRDVKALVAPVPHLQEPAYYDGMTTSDEFCLAGIDGKCGTIDKAKPTREKGRVGQRPGMYEDRNVVGGDPFRTGVTTYFTEPTKCTPTNPEGLPTKFYCDDNKMTCDAPQLPKYLLYGSSTPRLISLTPWTK
jgi:Caspase domain